MPSATDPASPSGTNRAHHKMDAPLVPVLATQELLARAESGAAAALPDSAPLLDVMPVAVYLCDATGRMVFCNRAALAAWGRRADPGSLRHVEAPEMLQPDGQPFPAGRGPVAVVLRCGEAVRGADVVIARPDGSRFEATVNTDPLLDPAGGIRGAIVVFQDVSQRKRHERHARLLIALTEQLEHAVDEDAILMTATRLVGEHLDVQRCTFVAADEARGEIFSNNGWRRTGLRSLMGSYRIADFFQPTLWEALTSGPVAIDDVALHPMTGAFASAYAALGVRSLAAYPCSSARPRVFVLTVIADTPRAWLPDELELLEHVGARVWPRVERARATAALRESEEHLRVTVDALPTAVYTCDAAGRLTHFNPAAAALWGREPKLGEDCWTGAVRTFNADGAECAPEKSPMALALLEQRVVAPTELIIERADGTRRHVVSNPQLLRHTSGVVIGAVNMQIDITDRKAAEREAQETAARFRALVRAAPSIVWTASPEGRITFVSDQWIDYAGPRESIGLFDPSAAMHPEDAPRRASAWSRALATGEDYREEVRLRRHDGEYRWFLSRGVAARDGSGRILGWHGTTTDIHDLKIAEQALRESEQRLRMATRAGKVGIWDWDIVRNRLAWTESLHEIHGAKPDGIEPTLENFLALVHPADRAAVQRAIASTLEHDTPYELEFRAIRANGGVAWLFSTATVLRANGRAVRMLGATLDVTAKKSAELALRESEHRFRTLASHAPVGIFFTDPNGDCVFANENWRAMAGLSMEQARGDGWVQALHPDDRARVAADWYAAAAEGRPFHAEYRFCRVDGTVTWLQGSTVELRDARGDCTGYIGTVVDITQRKLADDALRRSERRFRTLSTHAPVGIFVTDQHGDTTFVNESWQRIVGMAAAAVTGRGWEALIHPDDRERVVAQWNDAVQRGAESSAEYRFLRQDGRVIWVQGNAVELHDDAGRPSGYIGTIVDVTERREMEDALRHSEARYRELATRLEHIVEERTASLREAIAQMEEFSYSVSHDLRAPLRAMNAYAQAMAEDYGPQLDETARNYLARIQRSSERMERLTHDMLAYTRVARAEIVLADVDVERLLAELIAHYAELQPMAANIEIAGPLHRVRAHELSLGQCLANLLVNATKFVAPGVRPHIRVSTELRPDTAGPAGVPRVRIWVADNGIGIEPPYQERLFRTFERVPTPHRYEGTGMGLAIVRKAVEKMGGACGVESDGRSGSRFWIELGAA